MQFIYHDQAGDQELILGKEDHNYLIKVRRFKVDDQVYLRALQRTEILYAYTIERVERSKVVLRLQSEEKKQVRAKQSLHLGWCVIDHKSIEKVLPSLNELGVEKISFIYCDRSQQNSKLDIARFERLVRASSQQCGRDNTIVFERVKNLETFLAMNGDAVLVDFSENFLAHSDEKISSIVIGCEGGFSEYERSLTANIQGLDHALILRSETAAVVATSKLLL
jgi:16S rRNA (uracil1498-N3)-methyltransferase